MDSQYVLKYLKDKNTIATEACTSMKMVIDVNSTLAVSNIRNRTYTDYEVYLIDYGYGNFKEKIHFME